MPSRILRVGHILRPLGHEAGDVHVEGGSAHKDLNVARPAQPFVALRAVGRHIDEIALLSPDDVVLKLVEQRVGTFKSPVGSISECSTMPVIVSRVTLPVITCNLDIAEAVKGELRLPDFFAARP